MMPEILKMYFLLNELPKYENILNWFKLKYKMEN